jgi:hypothetical protein
MNMKRHLRAALAVLALVLPCAVPAAAQTGWVTVSGTKLEDSSQTLANNATICFTPTSSSGTPISYRVNGAGQAIRTSVCAGVTNGAWTITLADTNLTYPQNVCFSALATDNSTGATLLGGPGSGYQCVQPAYNTTSPNNWCSSGACNFDAYEPVASAIGVTQAPSIAGVSATQLDAGSQPTAMVTGSAGAGYHIDFGIPAGANSLSVGVNGSGVGSGTANFNDSTPAAPSGSSNVHWQKDSNGNISAYVTVSATGGLSALGSIVTGHCAEWASATQLGDAGAACGTGSGGGAATWGSIGGTLANQTDLQAALSGKVSTTVTINGHALSANISLGFSDLAAGALPNGTTAPTQSTGDTSQDIANDAFVHNVVNAIPAPTYSKLVTYELPAQGDIIPLIDLPNAVTVKRVFCSIKDGTNVTFNLYKVASEANPWTTSGGTAVFGADQTCTTSGLTLTSFASAAVGTHIPLIFSVTSESGNPSFIDITVEYQ